MYRQQLWEPSSIPQTRNALSLPSSLAEFESAEMRHPILSWSFRLLLKSSHGVSAGCCLRSLTKSMSRSDDNGYSFGGAILIDITSRCHVSTTDRVIPPSENAARATSARFWRVRSIQHPQLALMVLCMPRWFCRASSCPKHLSRIRHRLNRHDRLR